MILKNQKTGLIDVLDTECKKKRETEDDFNFWELTNWKFAITPAKRGKVF